MNEKRRNQIRKVIAEEVCRLRELSSKAAAAPAGLDAKISASNLMAMCLGASMALAWAIGEAERPSIEIPLKVQELK
jgi:hypothetical protein